MLSTNNIYSRFFFSDCSRIYIIENLVIIKRYNDESVNYLFYLYSYIFIYMCIYLSISTYIYFNAYMDL